MQIRIHGNSVVVEYESNAEIAQHIAILSAVLQEKLKDPQRMIVNQLNIINPHGKVAGELIHRTEY